MTKIAITGVTGKLGGYLAGQLAKLDIESRHLARRPEKAQTYANAELVQSFYDESDKTIKSLTGIEVLFMISARESLSRLDEHKALLRAAQKAGVKHIIYTSFMNARPDAIFTLARDHAWTESYIKELGFTYTFLRDNFYQDMFLEIAEQASFLRGPAGQGKVSAVLRSDVAAVALRILQEPAKWENQTLNLTGPQALSLEKMATLLSQYLGKEVTYYDEGLEEAYEWRKQWPVEDWQYDAWVSTYTAIANDELSLVSNDIEKVLGRPATSLQDFLKNR
ncbi:NAD(P)-dependent oxidoreductase [Streptococcus penaeicida]|uniref:NAD(P)-dependent oxidoreductase n=1 Tax=Streptococcus penaeicida TaxID=1765960 RepID=A0A2N8LBQ8_9STRE|nr:SDR family oxidoreductase [Streptococcus penaeicida]PND47582.1 NAD(P)-dependent oxidoreductase [Streptococcus penaeicida]